MNRDKKADSKPSREIIELYNCMSSIWRMWWHYQSSRRHRQSGPYDPATKNARGLSLGTGALLGTYNIFFFLVLQHFFFNRNSSLLAPPFLYGLNYILGFILMHRVLRMESDPHILCGLSSVSLETWSILFVSVSLVFGKSQSQYHMDNIMLYC